jgi:membrane protein DedA with SNARE-associated domain
MRSLLQILTSHPYMLLAFSALLERIGFPLFLSPVVIAAGALAATGRVHFDLALWITLIACVAGDTLWYEVGRKKGAAVLHTLCRISLEPESCVRRSMRFFDKGVRRTLLLSKWLPGVSHIIPAVAGLSDISRETFFLTNLAGSALWIIVFLLTGYVPIARLHLAPAIGPVALEAAVVLLVGNIGIKYFRRRRFLRDLYKARIAPQDVLQMLDAGQQLVILDLRHPLDSVTDPRTLPGALRVLPDDLISRADGLPKNREIILYCT